MLKNCKCVMKVTNFVKKILSRYLFTSANASNFVSDCMSSICIIVQKDKKILKGIVTSNKHYGSDLDPATL